MAFEKKVPEWHAPGTEPAETLKNKGFEPGYKPPADVFNWFWHKISEAVSELQKKAATAENVLKHEENKNNPHGVTTEQIGAAKAEDLNVHKNNKENPHGVTAAQVGARPKDWLPTPEDIGAVKKSGDTMTGDLHLDGKNVYANQFATNATDETPIFALIYGGDNSVTFQANNRDWSSDNWVRLYRDATVFGKPLNVASGGTGVTTQAGLQGLVREAGTADLTAGTSALPTGMLYFVYE